MRACEGFVRPTNVALIWKPNWWAGGWVLYVQWNPYIERVKVSQSDTYMSFLSTLLFLHVYGWQPCGPFSRWHFHSFLNSWGSEHRSLDLISILWQLVVHKCKLQICLYIYIYKLTIGSFWNNHSGPKTEFNVLDNIVMKITQCECTGSVSMSGLVEHT